MKYHRCTLYFQKLGEMLQNLLSAAVIFVALRVNSLSPGNFHMLYLSSADFFQNQTLLKNSECQPVWIQIRHNVWSGLIFVQTV